MEPHSPLQHYHHHHHHHHHHHQFIGKRNYVSEEFGQLALRTRPGNFCSKFVQCLCVKSPKLPNRWRSPKDDTCKFPRHSRGLSVYTSIQKLHRHKHTNTHAYLQYILCRFWRSLGHPARLCQVPRKASSCGARIANTKGKDKEEIVASRRFYHFLSVKHFKTPYTPFCWFCSVGIRLNSGSLHDDTSSKLQRSSKVFL